VWPFTYIFPLIIEGCMIASHRTTLHVAGDVVQKTVLIVEDNAFLRHAPCESGVGRTLTYADLLRTGLKRLR
jgi:hypothetical protein